MTKINEIIENNLAAIAKKEMESEDYIEGIEKAVKGGENPLENRDLLPKRKKK